LEVGKAFDHLLLWADVHHVASWGPLVGVYEDTPEGAADVVAEAWMPLAPGVRDMDSADVEVLIKEVPAETVACCTYHGFPDELASAITALFAWIDEQGLQRSAPEHRQIYHETPPGQPGAWVVEIQVPVRPT